jgi:hypothetical protein
MSTLPVGPGTEIGAMPGIPLGGPAYKKTSRLVRFRGGEPFRKFFSEMACFVRCRPASRADRVQARIVPVSLRLHPRCSSELSACARRERIDAFVIASGRSRREAHLEQ